LTSQLARSLWRRSGHGRATGQPRPRPPNRSPSVRHATGTICPITAHLRCHPYLPRRGGPATVVGRSRGTVIQSAETADPASLSLTLREDLDVDGVSAQSPRTLAAPAKSRFRARSRPLNDFRNQPTHMTVLITPYRKVAMPCCSKDATLLRTSSPGANVSPRWVHPRSRATDTNA
jgi:hypothetical protein